MKKIELKKIVTLILCVVFGFSILLNINSDLPKTNFSNYQGDFENDSPSNLKVANEFSDELEYNSQYSLNKKISPRVLNELSDELDYNPQYPLNQNISPKKLKSTLLYIFCPHLSSALHWTRLFLVQCLIIFSLQINYSSAKTEQNPISVKAWILRGQY